MNRELTNSFYFEHGGEFWIAIEFNVEAVGGGKYGTYVGILPEDDFQDINLGSEKALERLYAGEGFTSTAGPASVQDYFPPKWNAMVEAGLDWRDENTRLFIGLLVIYF